MLLRGLALGALVSPACFSFAPAENVSLRALAIPMANLPLLAMAYAYLLKAAGLNFWNGFGLQIPRGQVARLAGIVLAVVAAGLSGEWAMGRVAESLNLTNHWTEWFDPDLVWASGSVLTISLLEYVVFAPIFEELAFRGLLNASLRRRLTPLPAATISAGIFALAHGYGVIGLLSVFWSASRTSMNPTDVDVLIIGSGPAGAAAASMLQREGFRLLVVKKHRFPRFVIGESLLPCCMDFLQEAGLLDCVAEQRFMQKNGAVFHSGGAACNFDFTAQFTAGWKYTWQVPRAEFDKTLADAVAARGVEILYGHGVSAVRFDDDCATATLDEPDGGKRVLTVKCVLYCSGFGRVLPRLLDLEVPSHLPVREALFAHVTGACTKCAATSSTLMPSRGSGA